MRSSSANGMSIGTATFTPAVSCAIISSAAGTGHCGVVGPADLHRGGTVARASGSLRAALDAALSAPSRRGVLTDDDGRLLGTVRAADVLAAIEADGKAT